MKKNTKETNKGITLVALVITIIILLILAGISINALTESGLFEKAKEAKQKYENAEKLENELLKQYEKEANLDDPTLPSIPVKNIKQAQSNYMLEKTVNSSIQDEYGNKITIPAGFKIKSDESTNNAITVNKGIVIIDKNDNEFVWIPVEKIYTDKNRTEQNSKTIDLNRYTFDNTTGEPIPQNDSIIENAYQESSQGNITAKSITNFKNSVSINKGYYIGRYEARKNTEGVITEKPTDNIYNYVLQPQAAEVAQKMYDNTKPFTSDLTNSYAWDTATLFLQKCGTNQKYSKQKAIYSYLVLTGTNSKEEKDVQCNVYDMASNLMEWITETYNPSGEPRTNRGGCYNHNDFSTDRRSYCITAESWDNIGFRPILYL